MSDRFGVNCEMNNEPIKYQRMTGMADCCRIDRTILAGISYQLYCKVTNDITKLPTLFASHNCFQLTTAQVSVNPLPIRPESNHVCPLLLLLYWCGF